MAVKKELVPKVIGTIETVNCDCGWEAVFVLPEEADFKLSSIINHLVYRHKIKFPEITATTY